GKQQLARPRNEIPQDKRRAFEPAVRQQQLVREMERFTQGLVRQSAKVRNNSFIYSIMPELAEGQWSTARRHPTRSPGKFIEGAKEFRQRFREEGMGRFDAPLLPFNARTRKVAES